MSPDNVAANRIVGLETEYGLAYSARSGRAPEVDDVAKHLFQPVIDWGRATSVFLPNGSRLYLDVGSHPEIATAECSLLSEVLEQDRAGARTLERLAQIAQDAWEDSPHPGSIHLLRNNVDSAGNAFGCHENYMIPRKLGAARLAHTLIPFLVTRPLICGAGHIRLIDDRPRYVLSPRARHMWEAVSSGSTRSRPMINTRDEPHADAAKHRRLHVIVGDTNVSEASTLLKVASTWLVLDWLEAGGRSELGEIDQPVDSLRAVSDDADGHTMLTFDTGRRMSAVDVQDYFYEQAAAHAQRSGAIERDPLMRTALDLWRRTLDAWHAEDLSSVATTLDFEAKRRLLDRYAQRRGVDWDDASVRRLELAYHELAQPHAASLQEKLETSGLLERITTPDAVETARVRPPHTTRALSRGALIAASHASGASYKADWMTFRLSDVTETKVLMPDPLEAASSVASELIGTLPGSHKLTEPGASAAEIIDAVFASLDEDSMVPGGL
ncbi:proteasome accessory factor PafA2 family protein [Pseudoglutamicibacter cumminsii]|uniref:proteasome accessory factor PafA2 family protein n=1 Tax=Pseudoglutamicibacter cumminsii TaxID=156979 RepID=UPI0025564678|nr:proteasome accessory factor PafA2 family protein [Pseudoglutamicibacter cumminsii]MDZ3745772.1 proteasome accessory factor PafA2 family protein [Pseudoglutamicibacter cumminsii]